MIGWDEYVDSLIGVMPPGVVILDRAHADSDTPADPQIHESLIAPVTVEKFTSPDKIGCTCRSFPGAAALVVALTTSSLASR